MLEFSFIFINSKHIISFFSESQGRNTEITGQKLSTKKADEFRFIQSFFPLPCVTLPITKQKHEWLYFQQTDVTFKFNHRVSWSCKQSRSKTAEGTNTSKCPAVEWCNKTISYLIVWWHLRDSSSLVTLNCFFKLGYCLATPLTCQPSFYVYTNTQSVPVHHSRNRQLQRDFGEASLLNV